MTTLQQLEDDLNQALKKKNELEVLVLRQLKTAITNAEIAKNRKKLNTEEEIKLLRSEVKKRKESAKLYQQGNRAELADKEIAEIEIIKKYLPAEMDQGRIKQKVEEIVTNLGATSPADTGKVIGAVMKELGSQADGSVVSKLVQEVLSK